LSMTAKRLTVSAFLAALLVAGGVTPAAAAGVEEAIVYIQGRQNADGGFSEPGADSNDALTGWAVLAGVSGTDNPASLISFGAHALSYFSARAPSLTELPDIELCVLALSEVGLDPRNVQGRNLVAILSASAGSDGRIGRSIEEHCWGIIALVAAGERLPGGVTEWLVDRQRADGGWGESDSVLVSSTALAVEALVAAREADAGTVGPAMSLLVGRMNGDGGFSTGPGKASNARLTASVIRAAYAAGEDPASGDWDLGGVNPVAFLRSLQATDGHFQYSRGVDSEPALTTAMAVPALRKKHFPLAAGSLQSSGRKPVPADRPASPVKRATVTGADITSATDGANAAPGREGPVSGTADPSASEEETDGRPLATSRDYPSGVRAGVTASRTGWFSGVWLFAALCLAYLALVSGAAVIASKLSEPRFTPRP